MIGLPTETDEDLDGIIRLGSELLARGKRSSKRHVQINLSVSNFVPKPHTPFQWVGQTALEEIRRKQAYLQKGLRKRGLTLKLHDPQTSLLEGAFARGDRSLGRVIQEAARRGCRFDGWSECFDFGKWEESFRACGLDPAAYATRSFPLAQPLPWDHVQSGVTKKFLQQEYERAEAAEITANCRTECMHCGIGCSDGGSPSLGKAGGRNEKDSVKERKSLSGPAQPTTSVRMKYTKIGRVRYLSHLDFMTLFHRCTVRAGVPVAFSQGFNPHPRIAFGPALSVGIESDGEFLDMEIDPFTELVKVTKDLNNSLPPGIRIVEARVVPRNAPSLSASIGRYDYSLDVSGAHADDLEKRVNVFCHSPQ
jgi:hypothetical protein